MMLKTAIISILYAQEACVKWIMKMIIYCGVFLHMSKGVDEAQSGPWSP